MVNLFSGLYSYQTQHLNSSSYFLSNSYPTFTKKGLRYPSNIYTITMQQSFETMNEYIRRNTELGNVNKMKLGESGQCRSAVNKNIKLAIKSSQLFP